MIEDAAEAFSLTQTRYKEYVSQILEVTLEPVSSDKIAKKVEERLSQMNQALVGLDDES